MYLSFASRVVPDWFVKVIPSEDGDRIEQLLVNTSAR